MEKIVKEVERLATLARIELSKKDKERFSREISEILRYVEKVKKVATKDVSETPQVTGLENVYRKDEAIEITKADKNKNTNRKLLLKNAPAEKNGYIKTRAVLE